jgi:predicted transcriptional regulator
MTDETVREMSKRLAGEDREHMRALIARRRQLGLTQGDIALRLGVSLEWVHDIEKYDSDPRLSELRRYETAVTARGGLSD